MKDAALGRIRDNPFYVLGLRPSASRAEIEREGQKLLGMLELKLASAATYPTPVGPGARTADKVRQAMAALRDPERRLAHEVWARLDPRPARAALEDELDGDLGELPPPEPPGEDPRAPWPEALSALGWRSR
ncbi:molecular chaperone DnaJ [Sorangium cellulosum]|uniref:Molecular chaperone DnaJ n=1 Tax=Sorangium cellulosum TaxID=56 RepID=A0A2L0F7D7_SORCE|nr:hypothetical protein [Sorangium cellulosum]AUX47470.1 molecular chaperone DnaJ [Sorangium cellulosum]